MTRYHAVRLAGTSYRASGCLASVARLFRHEQLRSAFTTIALSAVQKEQRSITLSVTHAACASVLSRAPRRVNWRHVAQSQDQALEPGSQIIDPVMSCGSSIRLSASKV